MFTAGHVQTPCRLAAGAAPGWRFGVAVLALTSVAWRSSLYPDDWTPGSADAQGRFLHDFSYAGYRAGEVPPPDIVDGVWLDVSAPPYGVEPDGAEDVTELLQQALDDCGAAGGGVVFLPAGTYRVSVPPERDHALHLGHSHVVLRGAGAAATFLLNTTAVMREKQVLVVRPVRDRPSSWYWGPTEVRPLTRDLSMPTTRVELADTGGLAAGDWVVLRADATAAFIAEHGMTGVWSPAADLGPILYRRLVAVETGAVSVDAPTRYPMLLRDNLRLYRVEPHLEETGIEDLAVGNVQNDTPGTGDDDYAVAGTGAHEMHASFVILLDHVVNAWVRRVHTFRPPSNGRDVHLLSNFLRLEFTRFVSVLDCAARNPQYRGEGGNGYLFIMAGSDALVRDCVAENGRHNYTFAFMQTTGNVIHRSLARGGRLPSDFHQRLSAANLLDNVVVDGDAIEAELRDCCGHGHSTSQTVIWNTEGLAYPAGTWPWQWFIVESQQVGHGYVIGTRGPAAQARVIGGDGTEPLDLLEGVGEGATLEPASLYLDQLARRLHPGEDEGGGADGGPPEDGGEPEGDPVVPGDPSPTDGLTAPRDADALPTVVPKAASELELDGGCACVAASVPGPALGAWTGLLLRLARRSRRRSREAPPSPRAARTRAATSGSALGAVCSAACSPNRERLG